MPYKKSNKEIQDAAFKMKGHTLPGPNQRTPAKNTNPGEQTTNRLMEQLKGSAGMLSGAGLGERRQSNALVDGVPPDDIQQPSSQGEQTTSNVLNELAGGGGIEPTKKKVDVEVTVNGDPVKS